MEDAGSNPVPVTSERAYASDGQDRFFELAKKIKPLSGKTDALSYLIIL